MSSSAQQPATAQSSAPHRKTPSPPPPPPVADQELIIPYWTTETGWSSELQLRNNALTQDLTVTPALRLPDGSETPLAPVTIKSQEVKSIDVAAAISAAGAPQLIGTYGSAVLRYHSPSLKALYASVMIRAMGHAIAFHVDGNAEYEPESVGSREGIWWLPKDSTSDYLILTNQGQNALALDLSLYDASGRENLQKVLLGPHAINRLSVRSVLQTAGLAGSYGGIKVSAASHAGSLDTLHFVFDTGANFSAILKMFDHDPNAKLVERDFAATGVWTLRAPMLALSNPGPALVFPPDTVLQPQIFIRNATAKPIDAALRFNWRTGSTTGKAAGPRLHLLPYETRLVDVAALQDGAVLPKEANWTSVTLTSNALPDELMAVAASYDQTLKYGAQTPFSDQLSHEWKGGMWEFDPYHDSIITAGNGGTQPTQAAFTIFYNQGTQRYDLEQTLQPDEQMWIDVGKLIQQALPDKNGSILPRNLTSGSYEFRDLSHTGVGSLFEGKVIYDKTYGHAAYGCATCCGFSGNTTELWFNPINVYPTSPADDGVWGNNVCDGWVDVSSSFDGGWSSLDTTIVTVDTYGIHTAQGVGSTTTKTSGYLESNAHYPICPQQPQNPSGGANVLPSILLGGSSGTDITDTTQNVVVGQQIVLYGKYTLPSDYTFKSLSWTIPGTGSTPPTAISNFTVSADSTSGGPVSLTTNQLNQQQISFYWTIPTQANTPNTVTFTLNFTDNLNQSQSVPVTAKFNVAGPSNPNVVTCGGNVPSGNCPNGASGPLGQVVINTSNTPSTLGLGNATSSNVGIIFNASATPPSGYSNSFTWVQLLTANTIAITATPSVSCVQITIPQNASGTGFDDGGGAGFPYGSGASVNDNPDFPLQTGYGTQVTGVTEVNDSPFSATMYLLWSSGLANSISVPLGSVSWQWTGDATYSAQTQTWSLKSGSGSANAFVAGSSYPSWNSKVPFTGVTCH